MKYYTHQLSSVSYICAKFKVNKLHLATCVAMGQEDWSDIYNMYMYVWDIYHIFTVPYKRKITQFPLISDNVI